MPKIIQPNILRNAILRAVQPKKWSGTIVGKSTDRPGYTQVELYNGEIVDVYNPSVPNTAGYRVNVENVDGVMTIKSYRQVYSDAISAVTPEHHTSHEYPNNDTVWVWKDQFLPLLIYPTSGFTVTIYGGVLYAGGTWGKLENQTLDLTASIPTGAARWVLIQTDSAGVITTVNGSPVLSKTLLTYANLPAVTAGNLPLCAVKLYDGQTQLTRDPRAGKINDFLDLRFAGYSLDSDSFDIAGAINGSGASAITDADKVPFWEDVSGLLKHITWANAKATLQTFFETLFPRKYAGKTVAPTVNDDSGDGYAIGDRWLDETNDKEYVALDVTVGAAVWVEVGGGGGISIIDTRAVVMATTLDAGLMGLTTDTNELCVSLGGGSWLVSPFQLLTADPDPDIGLYEWNNRLGYGTDYVTDKLLANVWLGSNAGTTEGSIWVDPPTVNPRKLYVRLNSTNNTVIIDFSLLLGYLVHYPFSTTQAIKVWSGDSLEVGLNGIPVIQEYTSDIGAYPAPYIIHGGLF